LPLLRALRRLALLSRPLRASDCALSGEADSHLDDDVSIAPQRVTLGRDALQALRNECATFAAALAGPLADPITNRAAIVADADDKTKFEILRRAETEVSTAKTDPLPADPGDFRATLFGLRATCAARRQSFFDILSTTRSKVSDLLGDVRLLLPVTDIDPTPLTLEDEETAAVVFVQEVQTVLTAVMADIDSRLTASQTALDAAAGAADASDGVKSLQDAGKALYGEHFVLLPEFGMRAAHAAEMAAAVADGADGGPLLSYLQSTARIDL